MPSYSGENHTRTVHFSNEKIFHRVRGWRWGGGGGCGRSAFLLNLFDAGLYYENTHNETVDVLENYPERNMKMVVALRR